MEIVKYYGSRQKWRGDFLVKHKGVQYRIDHKSTENKAEIRVFSKWLPTLLGYCSANEEDDGNSIPLITISLKSAQKMYVLSYERHGKDIVRAWYAKIQGDSTIIRDLSHFVEGGAWPLYLNCTWPIPFAYFLRLEDVFTQTKSF